MAKWIIVGLIFVLAGCSDSNEDNLNFKVGIAYDQATSLTGKSINQVKIVNLNNESILKKDINVVLNRGNCKHGMEYINQYVESNNTPLRYGDTLSVDYVCSSLVDIQISVKGKGTRTFTIN